MNFLNVHSLFLSIYSGVELLAYGVVLLPLEDIARYFSKCASLCSHQQYKNLNAYSKLFNRCQ